MTLLLPGQSVASRATHCNEICPNFVPIKNLFAMTDIFESEIDNTQQVLVKVYYHILFL